MNKTDQDKLRIEKKDEGIAILIINNPEKKNAFNQEMIEEFPLALETLDRDDEVKAIILTGQGEHFSSGGDLDIFNADRMPEDVRKISRRLGKMVSAIQRIEKHVIAMVRGFAVGGGMSLVLACDMVYAEKGARFASNFIRLGVFPEMGSLYFLPLLVGINRAKELMFTAEIIDAEEAHRIGIVNKVLPKDTLEKETLAVAEKIAGMPPFPLRMSKRMINTTLLDQLEQALEWEAQATPLSTMTKEFSEQVLAFQSKKIRSTIK